MLQLVLDRLRGALDGIDIDAGELANFVEDFAGYIRVRGDVKQAFRELAFDYRLRNTSETRPVILVVDDQENIRKAMSRRLETIGNVVAIHPNEFVDHIGEHGMPDAAVFDYSCNPVGTWNSVVTAGGTRNIPVFIFSGDPNIFGVPPGVVVFKKPHIQPLIDALAAALRCRTVEGDVEAR